MELIEYVIAFGISAGVAGASVMFVNGVIPGLDLTAAASKSDQIASAAGLAVAEDRNVTLVLPLRSASISCADGTMSVSLGGLSHAYQVSFPCSFAFPKLEGVCRMLFSTRGGSLALQARC